METAIEQGNEIHYLQKYGEWQVGEIFGLTKYVNGLNDKLNNVDSDLLRWNRIRI